MNFRYLQSIGAYLMLAALLAMTIMVAVGLPPERVLEPLSAIVFG